MLETFFQDLKIGLRVLLKEKSFCALAVFVLAVGIGGVTTQYAVVNGVLLRAFDFPDADRLVDVQMVDPENFSPTNFNAILTTADFVDIRDQQTSFSDFVGYLNGSTVNLTYQNQPRRLQGGYVTHDFFGALGVQPVLGRDFLPEEDQPGVTKAVLLSDDLWRSDFGADPGVVGRPVRVNGSPGTIVGVMPPKFNFPTNEQLWVPVNAEFPVRARNDRNVNFIAIIARLKPDVSLAQAQAEITSLARQFAAEYPDTHERFTQGFVRPLIAAFTGGQLAGVLYTMLAFCVGVLVIACVNVMNMQFARATLRAKELAIRSSLGATRIRLIRQMLTESLLVAAIGAVVGIGIALWATDLLNETVQNLTTPISSWMTFDIDGKVLAVVVAATMLSAVVSGLVPAWMSSRTSSVEVLKESGRGNTGRGVLLVTRGLVVFQILVTCVLLIGSMLQLQSIFNQQALDYGYDPDSVLAARMGLMEGDYADSAERQLFYERLQRELRATGQFEGAALTDRFRMVFVFSAPAPVEIEGQQYFDDGDRPLVQHENVSPGYFHALDARILDGRDFTEDDSDQRNPVAIVNASFARRHWGNESPIGRRFRVTQRNGTNPGPWRTIVGVASDMRMQGPFSNQSDDSGFYVPFFATVFGPAAEAPVANQFGTVVVKPRGGQRPEALVRALQDVVNKVDPNLPLYFAETPSVSIDSFTGQNRIVATMFGLFGVIAISLAAVGLYGVMSFSVNQRTQEFGVRMALGANARRILTMVLRQGAIQLAIGLFLGLGLAVGISILGGDGLQNALFEISVRDPLTYIAVAGLIAVVALIATLVPARRATRVDPMIALRAE